MDLLFLGDEVDDGASLSGRPCRVVAVWLLGPPLAQVRITLNGMPLGVRVLGPLEVVCDGQPVVVPGAKERALLVRLALQAGRVVSTDRLIETLWDGDPPASAEASLRVLVSRLRRALAAAGADHAIGTCSPGYLLVADEVDVAQFAALSAQGRRDLAQVRPGVASTRLAEALALWRGERLAEVGTAYLGAESDRLEEVRVSVLQDRIGADLACGRHADVLDELTTLCRSHPLREGLWAQWITALYRCDRQADALEVYQNLRRTLAEELGIDPSVALRRLEAAVLAQDSMLDPPEVAPWTAVRPLPPRLDLVERVPFAGREDELRALNAAWAAASAGMSGTVMVSGEPGIGKSRLLRETARLVVDRGGIVLHGRCDSDLVIPYQPFRECLSRAVAEAPGHVLGDVEALQLAELSRLLPGLANRGPGLPPANTASPDVERYLLFGGVASLLHALAGTAPVLMVLDDLQWADRPTLQLLLHLTELDLGRILLVGAHRDSERSDGPLMEALGALHRHARITRIVLSGLTRRQGAGLMAAVAGLQPDDTAGELADLLHQETGGNPFYLSEMLRHLLETNVITPLPNGRCSVTKAVTSAGLPDSIREVLRARLARLGAEATRMLEYAAVIGQEFDLELVAGATAVDEDRTLDLLEAAGRSGLIHEAAQPVGRFRFSHALVQHTLYGGIGPARRTRVHARVAAAMEALGRSEPGELAYHYLAGVTSGTTGKAIDYARAAAAQALAMSAPGEAARWYSAALNALPPPRDDLAHVRAQLDLGIAQRQAGDAAYRGTLLAAAGSAQRQGADDLLIAAALASSRGGFSSLGQVDVEKVGVLEAALTVKAPEAADRARLLATLAGELTWHPDHRRRIRLTEEAVDVARRSSDQSAVFYAIVHPGAASWVPETSERRVRLFREAFDLAGRANDPIGRIEALNLLAPMLLERAEADRLDDALDRAAEVAAEIREPYLRSMTSFTRSCMVIARGNLDLAEGQLVDALKLGLDGGQLDAQHGYDEVLGIIRWHQGRLSEVLPKLRETHALLPAISTRRAGLAFAEAVSGDREQAKAMLREAAEHNFDVLYGAPWLGCMCQWAAVAAEVGDTAAAASLYTKLSPWKHLFGTGGPMPVHGVSHSLARLAALLRNTSTAEQHFANAWHIHHTMRAPFYIAETALHWGRLLKDRKPEQALPLLTEALDLARRHGFGRVEHLARKALPGNAQRDSRDTPQGSAS